MQKNSTYWVRMILLTILSGSSLVMADNSSLIEPNQSNYSQEFKSLDINGDGKLSASEVSQESIFKKGGFDRADKNHNHSLSEDEFTRYKSSEQQKIVKRSAKDATITTKIKSQYLVEKNFKSLDVSVETQDGAVILSGFVKNVETKKRAEQIAKGVSGVKSVKNALVVKP